MDPPSGVVKLETTRIYHGPALDIVDMYFSFVVELERIALGFPVVGSHQVNESVTAPNQLFSDIFWPGVKLKRMYRVVDLSALFPESSPP